MATKLLLILFISQLCSSKLGGAQHQEESVLAGFNVSTYTVNEGEMVTLTTVLNATASSEITFDLVTEGGSANGPGDYEPINTTLFIPAGNNEYIVTLLVKADNITENPESFTVQLLNPSEGVILADIMATINIVDLDVATVVFNPVQYTVAEDAGQISFIIEILTSTERPLSINCNVSAGTAQEGVSEDYRSFSLFGIMISAGTVAGQTVTTPVPIIDDTNFEPTEYFTISIIPDPIERLYTIEGQGTATAFIVDDDSLIFGFDQTTYSVREGTPSVAITISRMNGMLGGNVVTITLRTEDGTATSTGESDFVAQTLNLTFTSGNDRETVMISILDDSYLETNEQFNCTLTLTGTDDPSIHIQPALTIVTIIDNDIGDPEPAKIIRSPDGYSTAIINKTFTTSCHGYGIELPAITWNKHGVQLTNDARIAINQRYVSWNSTHRFTTSILTIHDTELEDTGNYSCIARNSNGTDVQWFLLKVFIPAQLSSIPSNVTVDLCSNITLTCEGYGLPAPTITWKHDDTQINIIMLSIATVTVYHNASNGITYISSNLSISSVRYQDRGLYMCSIQNEFGNGTTTSSLSINYEAADIINLTADQLVVNESDFIRISCEARGSPPLVITWHRAIRPNNFVRLSETTRMHSTSTDESCNITVQQSVIEIHSARAEDGVAYICQAQNDHPYVVASERLKITVHSLDECASAPCQNGGECTDVYLDFSCNCVGTNHTGNRCQEPLHADVGPEAPPSPNISNITTTSTTQNQLVSPVNLTCEATGAPPLTYRWYRDGQLIEGKIRPYLYIPDFSPEDRGNYSCEVINDKGKDESDGVLLTIKGVRQYRIYIKDSEATVSEQTLSEIYALLLRNNSSNVNGEVYGLITLNETDESSAAIIITIHTSESYSSDRIHTALTQVLYSVYSALTFDIERYDGCLNEDDIILYWPESEIGHSITFPCPCQNLIGNPATPNRSLNITRRCGGSYSMGAHWEKANYQTQCGLTDIAIELCIANIVRLQSAENDPEQLSQSLIEITNRSEEIQAVGISIATTLIEALTDDAIENEEIRDNYLTTIDNLIQADEEQVAESQTVGEAPMRLLSSLGDFADKVNLSNTSTILTRETYAILIEDIDRDSFIGETLTVNLGSVEDAFRQGNKIEENALNKEEGTNSSLNENFTATVRVPQSIFKDDNGQKQRLSYSVFVQGSLFLNQNASQQSIIVGVRVNGAKKIGMLRSPINVYLQRQQMTNNSSENVTCGRWNTTIHGWSTNDCRISNFTEFDGKQSSKMMETADNGTTAKELIPTVYETKFYQPGYFGLILDLTYGIVDPLPHQFTFTLEVISYICLVLSLVCLTFLIITYLATKQLRNNYHGQILINMSISLACLYLTFLIGARAAPVPALCGISAALLQYFLLVFFGWTVVEAVYLYRNLVQVLISQMSQFVLRAGLIVWILPILVVVLSAGPGYKDYYINDRSFCRSKGLPFWLGLILPFLILNIFNLCVFIMIMVSLTKRSMDFKEKVDLKDKFESVKKQVAIAVGLAILFGLGWGFGLASSSTTVKGVTFTFQLLFSLFVGLQGVILFVLHGVRKWEARGQWKEWFTKVSSKSIQLYTIAKSASTATDSRIEMSTLQRSEKKDWGNVPTPDINESESKSMITKNEKSEKEDLGTAQKSTASVKESDKEAGTAHGFTKFNNEN